MRAASWGEEGTLQKLLSHYRCRALKPGVQEYSIENPHENALHEMAGNKP